MDNDKNPFWWRRLRTSPSVLTLRYISPCNTITNLPYITGEGMPIFPFFYFLFIFIYFYFFIQVGRAGRDGERATCTTLVSAADLPLLRSMIYGGTPSEEAVRGLLRAMFAGGEDEADFSFYDMSQVGGWVSERIRDVGMAVGVVVGAGVTDCDCDCGYECGYECGCRGIQFDGLKMRDAHIDRQATRHRQRNIYRQTCTGRQTYFFLS